MCLPHPSAHRVRTTCKNFTVRLLIRPFGASPYAFRIVSPFKRGGRSYTIVVGPIRQESVSSRPESRPSMVSVMVTQLDIRNLGRDSKTFIYLLDRQRPDLSFHALSPTWVARVVESLQAVRVVVPVPGGTGLVGSSVYEPRVVLTPREHLVLEDRREANGRKS